jgi:DNA-binding HxlR family transcriptional regulator
LRRSEILKEVGSFCADADWLGDTSILHDSILTRTLRKLVGNGLLARHEAENAFPPNVRYSLQPGAAAILEEFLAAQRGYLSKRFGGSAHHRERTSKSVTNAHPKMTVACRGRPARTHPRRIVRAGHSSTASQIRSRRGAARMGIATYLDLVRIAWRELAEMDARIEAL